MIHKTKEFRELSNMAAGDIFNKCDLVELSRDKNDNIEILDEHKLDFYYVLKGHCTLEF
jgi:hypothetical protein